MNKGIFAITFVKDELVKVAFFRRSFHLLTTYCVIGFLLLYFYLLSTPTYQIFFFGFSHESTYLAEFDWIDRTL